MVEDTSIQDAEERRKDLAAKIEKKKEYLNCWYHNHVSPKVWVLILVPVVLVTFKKQTHHPQLVQLYCKKYYSSHIKPLIVEVLNGKVPTKKEFLTLLHIHSTAALDDETPKVKAQMKEKYQKWLSKPVEELEEEVTPTPEDCASQALYSTSQVPQPTQPQSEPSSPAEMLHSATSPIATITPMVLTLGDHKEMDLNNDLWHDFDLEWALTELTQTFTILIGFNSFEGLRPPGQFPSMPYAPPPIAAITDAISTPPPLLPPILGSAATVIATINTPAL
ncbi:hypothetical protein BDN71DRAFT_1510279 [Pleurotus eryngii]|uniref:Uncharacterized protein n=1 Tax=Pleurotus eryngii TaxID=5323 RepID=A0A9P6D3T2_PLEER|nr:hypothetical protein BDN71DRAFT_1510279 [Pleurotus eryngii]